MAAKLDRQIYEATKLVRQLRSLRRLSPDIVNAAEKLRRQLARGLIHPTYREYLEDTMSDFVWKYRLHKLLQADAEALVSRTLPYRNIFYTTPPRHGKTSMITIPLPAYWLRNYPKDEVIVAMHSQRIANKVSRKTRGIVRRDIGVSEEVSNVQVWETSNGGRYQCTGVGGFISGTGGHLLVADDLVPNRKSAESEVKREGLHNWWVDDFITRRNPGRSFVPIVMVMTRWHVDDIAGRVVNPDDWLIRRLPALCDYDPSDPDANTPCPLGREYGDALAPALWPRRELLKIKANMSEYSWLALYQGRPTSKAGLFFDVTMLEETEHVNPDSEVVEWVRYFDFASSPDPDSAYTATVLMGLHKTGEMVIAHLDRVREGPGERDRWQRRYAEADAKVMGEGRVAQVEEKQPGAAGKDRVRAFAKLMRGHRFGVDKIEGQGSKTTRADPYASTMASGLMYILKTSPHGFTNNIQAFKDEHRAFPLGKLKDWVDAGSGAHNYLTRKNNGQGAVAQGLTKRKDRIMERRGRYR